MRIGGEARGEARGERRGERRGESRGTGFARVLSVWMLLAAVSCSLPVSAGDTRETPDRLSDLVTVKDGVMRLDRFEECRVEGREQPLEVLVHSEAKASELSRDRFVARTAVAVVERLDELAGTPAGGSRVCREVAGPDGDVDYELRIAPAAEPVEVQIVDVNKQNLTRPTSVRYGSNACQQDVQGNTFCASAPQGVAVKSGLGKIVCARGQCVRGTMEEWHCSRASGGWAEMISGGQPQCEQGCYRPTSRQCQRMR